MTVLTITAMANHGYLPHNGVATIVQVQSATEKVFGMAPDFGAFLAIYGAVVDGTLTSWSIRGTPHVGIGGSHGNYETGSSPLRADLNQFGSSDKLVMSQFYQLHNSKHGRPKASPPFDISLSSSLPWRHAWGQTLLPQSAFSEIFVSPTPFSAV